MTAALPKELEQLARELGDINKRARSSLRVSMGEGDKSLLSVHVIGIIEACQQLIVSAPTAADGGLIVVRKGQVLTFHWVNQSNVFGFPATVTKVAFEPVALLHLQLDKKISQREVRSLPRALVNLACELRTPDLVPVLLIDLSVGGGRIAVAQNKQLAVGQQAEMVATLHMLGRDFPVTLACTITGSIESAGSADHAVQYYGLKFDNLSDVNLLTLHGYVQECLSLELDTLTQVLKNARHRQS